MDRIQLKAEEREVLGKKVKLLRKAGLTPAHVFGHGLETEHVSVNTIEFTKLFAQTGETGLIDLRIGQDKVRPVMVREVQMDFLKDTPLHIDFYQVDLNVAVQVTVPIELIGEQPESVKLGETVVIQPLNEIQVEALPGHIPDVVKVDISPLQQINDTILVKDLQLPSEVTVLTDPESVVAKLDIAVVEEVVEEVAPTEEEAAATEGEASAEGAEGVSGEEASGEEGKTEEAGGEDKGGAGDNNKE